MIEIRRLTPKTVNSVTINMLLRQLSRSGNPPVVTVAEAKEILTTGIFYAAEAVTGPTSYVGVATIFFQHNFSGWIAEIHDVIVDEEHRGKGFGEALIKKLLDVAQEFSDAREVKLKLSLTSKPARKEANPLYLKLGFELVAEACGEHGTNLYMMTMTPKQPRD